MQHPSVTIAVMGRARRVDGEGGWHHVVNRGVARGDVYFDDRDRVEFGRLLGVAHERFGVVVHAYCLMTNHFHLLVECPDGGVSDAMHLVGSSYVRHVNERLGRDGPLFRSRFWARPVGDDADLVQVVRYIHRNPLAIVGEAALESYRWSSYRTYLGYRQTPGWMGLGTVSGLVGGRHEMHSLVEGGQAAAPVSGNGFAHLVSLAIDDEIDGAATNGVDRTVLALLLDHVDPAAAERIRLWLAYSTRAAEHSARTRARRRADRDPAIGRVAAAVLRAAA